MLTKCDGLLFLPGFMMLLFVFAHKVGWCFCFDLFLILLFVDANNV